MRSLEGGETYGGVGCVIFLGKNIASEGGIGLKMQNWPICITYMALRMV